MPIHGMFVRPDDPRQLTRTRAADDDELHPLTVVFEEAGDVVMRGDRIDMHVGMAAPQLLNSAFQFMVHVFRFHTNGKHRCPPQRRLHHRPFDDRLTIGCIVLDIPQNRGGMHYEE